MIVGLLVILGLILVLPFVVKKIEENLEYFLFVMGLAAIIVSGVLDLQYLEHTLTNYLIYTITGAVLIAGLLFNFLVHRLRATVNWMVDKIQLRVFVFLLIVLIGLLSSIITAIVASLLLVEIIEALPLTRDKKIKINIIACFSIGIGAVLTPVGEPLSTVVISTLREDFFYLIRILGIDIMPTIFILGLLGAYVSGTGKEKAGEAAGADIANAMDGDDTEVNTDENSLKEVFIRAGKIFVFVIALEFLGSGFRPLIDTYVVSLNSKILYFINMLSAILDNATMAAAEISQSMSEFQIKSLLISLLVSGGMLIPGNIPNIISAGKLNIKSKEWAKYGLPLGLVLLTVNFLISFVF